MKKQSRTVPRRRQSVSPTPRHLPLVDILIDTQAELQELVVASGLKVLEREIRIRAFTQESLGTFAPRQNLLAAPRGGELPIERTSRQQETEFG